MSPWYKGKNGDNGSYSQKHSQYTRPDLVLIKKDNGQYSHPNESSDPTGGPTYLFAVSICRHKHLPETLSCLIVKSPPMIQSNSISAFKLDRKFQPFYFRATVHARSKIESFNGHYTPTEMFNIFNLLRCYHAASARSVNTLTNFRREDKVSWVGRTSFGGIGTRGALGRIFG
jgi:hypothetical protein